MPLLKAVLDANVLITKIQLELCRGFTEFKERIPFSKETEWLFETYSRRNFRFVMVPNVELTVLERFRKETLLIHELQKRILLKEGEEFQELEDFFRSSKFNLEDTIIKIAFLHYKGNYAYFQTFRTEKFRDVMKKKSRNLKMLYYKILGTYGFEICRPLLDSFLQKKVEEFRGRIFDQAFISFDQENRRRKYVEREDREILCDVFEYCHRSRRRDFKVIFLTNDKAIIRERSKIEYLAESSFSIYGLSELYDKESKYEKLW
jgi:hypothetical protein